MIDAGKVARLACVARKRAQPRRNAAVRRLGQLLGVAPTCSTHFGVEEMYFRWVAPDGQVVSVQTHHTSPILGWDGDASFRPTHRTTKASLLRWLTKATEKSMWR